MFKPIKNITNFIGRIVQIAGVNLIVDVLTPCWFQGRFALLQPSIDMSHLDTKFDVL